MNSKLVCLSSAHGLSSAKQALLEKRLKGSVRQSLPQIISRRPNGVCPLSFAQQRLWFLLELDPLSAAYNIPSAIQIRGDLDISALNECVNEIVRRHEVLRTRFVTTEEGPRQVIEPELSFTIEMLDCSGLKEGQKNHIILSKIREEGQRPFDLSSAPLFRASLFSLGDRDGHPQYIFMVTLHHIISDGWSAGILFKEFSAIYLAYNNKQKLDLPPLTIQYADFSHWQRQWLKGTELEKQMGFWKTYLEGMQPLLELPTDRARSVEQGSEGATFYYELPAGLTNSLNSLSRNKNVTLFSTLLTAFFVLLERYSGQSDICVGVPVANRNHEEVEGLIGFFVNTLVMRADLSGNPSFAELLDIVHQDSQNAQAHQDLPFEKLVEELQPPRDLSHTPLFQVMFVLHNVPAGTLEIPGLSVDVLEVDYGTSKFDLLLHITEKGECLHAALEYSTALFDSSRIVRMAGHFQALLESIVITPDSPIGQLNMLTADENQRIVADWNNTDFDYLAPLDIIARFESQVDRTPEAIAAGCGENRITYSELNSRSNRVAHGLIARGVGPDVIVAILDDRGIDFLVTIVGIFKAGGAYLPLEPSHPDSRLTQILSESQVKFLVSGSRYRERVHGLVEEFNDPPIVFTLSDMNVAENSAFNPPKRYSERNLAFVIFTSGSTGAPKGAMVEHRGMFNNLITKVPVLELCSTDAIAQTASQCFDISVWQFLTALACGARVEVFPDGVTHDPYQLLNRLSSCEVSILEAVPSMIRALLDAADHCFELPKLRWLLSCGEEFPPELCRRWMARFPHVRLLNAFGPAECSDDVSYHSIDSPPNEDETTIPVGRPVHNSSIYILNHWLQPVPIGVPGEIYVAGVQVGRGYLGRPDITAASFIPNPFWESGGRLYRTGDLGKYREDGVIEFLGRSDYQVKIRGFRIELAEIEAHLLQYRGVSDAAVLAREDRPGDKRLVAYVVGPQSNTNNSSLADELREYLKSTLPAFMVPASIVVLDAMPLNNNGKINRSALPVPDRSGSPAYQYVGPSNPIEEQLVNIWVEVLNVRRVGVNDSFFDLGGHSLLATQVVSRIRKTFGVELSLRVFFESPTVASIAKGIQLIEQAQMEIDQVNEAGNEVVEI